MGPRLAFAAVGIVPWLLVNSLFLQIVPLVDFGGQSIATYLGVAVQASNILPVAIVYLFRIRSCKAYRQSFSVLLVATILLAYAYSIVWSLPLSYKTKLGALLTLAFFSGVVGTSSNVITWPYIASYQNERYITAFSVGTGISSLFPILLSAVQYFGTSKPRFSFTLFFILVGTEALLCSLCYLLIPPHTHSTSPPSVSVAVDDASCDDAPLLPHIDNDITAAVVMQGLMSALQFTLPGLLPFFIAGSPNMTLLLTLLPALSAIVSSTARFSCTHIKRQLDALSPQRYDIVVRFLFGLLVVAYTISVLVGDYGYPVYTLYGVLYCTITTLFSFLNTLFYLGCSHSSNGIRHARRLGIAEQCGACTGTLATLLATLYLF